jgi:REP element-mobilizing transposase RayT
MHHDPKKPQRKIIRLKGYDYSKPGYYFITTSTQNKLCLFGQIVNREMILNEAGKMVHNEWLMLTNRFNNIVLHRFVVMPNHFHAILEIVSSSKGKGENATEIKRKTVGDMIGAFKSIVTVNYIQGVKQSNWKPFYKKLWQRSYWDIIFKTQESYYRISAYIKENPSKKKKNNSK